MSSVCGEKTRIKCVMLVTTFILVVLLLFIYRKNKESQVGNNQEMNITDLKEFINTNMYFSRDVELHLRFIKKNKDHFKKLSGKLSKEGKELLDGYKNVIVEIEHSDIDREIFKTIIETFIPEELNIYECCLDGEATNNIKLNENIKIFRLASSGISSIRNIDGLFGSWNKKLIKVDISDNNLETLPAGLEDVASLRELNISYNKLETVLIPLENLERLRIVSNHSLRKLDIHNCKNLKKLDIHNCKNLKELDIHNCKNLKELDIHNCKKLTIDGEFLEDLCNIRYLNIIGIPLENGCSEIFGHIKNLKVLGVDENIIGCIQINNTKIAKSFSDYTMSVCEDMQQD